MNVAAAIRAETNQLEMQRKKKQQQQQSQTAELNSKQPSSSRSYPQKSRSFHDERNQFNPYAAQQVFPHYVNSEYQFENKDIDCEDADSITSSLSGTLPGTITDNNNQSSPARELQKLDMLKATVKAELDELRSANEKSGHSDSTTKHISSKSLPPPRLDNQQGSSSRGGIVNLSISAAKSVGSTSTRERITPGGNIIVMDTDDEEGEDAEMDHNYFDQFGNIIQGSNNKEATKSAPATRVVTTTSNDDNSNINNNTNNSSNNATPSKSNRIEEIMTAYQGKVETILKKRGEEHSFQTLIEKNQQIDNTPHGGGTNNLSSSITSSGTPNSGIENILDTYKKKVDEIMNSPTKPMPPSVGGGASSYSAKQQPSLAVNFDKIEDDDDEKSFAREGGLDDRFARTNSGGGNDDDRSYNSREDETYSSGSSRSSHSSYNSGSESSRSSYGQDGGKEEGKKPTSFSERATAILNSINSPRTATSGEAAGGELGGGDEGSGDDDSHISGASSASEKSGLASLRSQDKLGTLHATESKMIKNSALKSSSSKLPFGRKDSLTRAQEITGLSPKKSKSLHQDGPTTIQSEIEVERLYRLEVERRLAESMQREDELTLENRRLEKNLAEVQSQLDDVNSMARSNKYSSSEQASKIRELERKLKNEKERCEELERERDAIKEEYDQDLEEQKDINRQLEQMVMSEDFEKELEDEINQVKELEHANRRFKVKIDMLEREKNAIMKRYDGKMEDSTNKIKTLEEQQKEWEGKVGTLETANREMEEKWEAKLEEEKRYARELRFNLEKAEDKIKVLEAELVDLRDSNSKIEEYEQVLGKLMERNEELEAEVQTVMEENDTMIRRDELEEKRNALRVKELEQKIEEQQVYIEQQQETLDESVKTILKMYSLNNGQGDDMSTMTEEQLTGIARTMIPRASGRQKLPTVRDDVPSTPADSTRPSVSNAFNNGAFTRRRDIAIAGRSRSANALNDDVETLMQESESRVRARSRGRAHQQETDLDRPLVRARSRGRPSPRQEEEFDDARARARSKSRGRGDRTESMRQLTERARTPGRTRSRSPGGYRRERDYDPSGPASDSRALVLATPAADSGRKYGGQYDIPQSSGQRQSRRDVGGKYDGYDGPRSGGRSDRHRRNYHEEGYRGNSNPRRGDRGGDRESDRRRSGGGDHYRRQGSDYQESRSYRNKNYSHNDDHYTPRRVPKDPSVSDENDDQDRQLRVMSDGDDGRQWSGSGNRRRSSRRHHPRERDRDY